MVRIVCLFIMLTNTFLVWEMTVERVFRAQDEISSFFIPVMGLGVFNRVVAAGLKLYLEFISANNTLGGKTLTLIVVKDTLCSLFFIACLFGPIYNSPFVLLV